MSATLKVILFDAAGTLIKLTRTVGSHYAEIAAKHGLNIPAETIDRVFREAWKAMPHPPATGVARPDDDRGWWQELVERVLDSCGGNGAINREQLFDELYEHFALPGVWEAYEEVGEVLASLQGRYRLGVISNFDGRLRKVLRHLQFDSFFEHLVISSEVGADKPHPLIFQRAISMFGVTPEEALHVGDHPVEDWQGAAEGGLRCFKLDRPANSLRDVLKILEST